MKARPAKQSVLAARAARRAIVAAAIGALVLSLAPRRRPGKPAAPVPPSGGDAASFEPAPTHSAQREAADIRAGFVAAMMAGFFAFVLLAGAGLFAFYRSRAHGAAFVPVATFPSPRLQTLADGLPEADFAREKAELQSFRWLDAEHHTFQIPIEDAMRIVAARGAEAYDPVARVTVDPRDAGAEP